MKTLLLSVFVCTLFTLHTYSYSGGDGSQSNPYQIASKVDFQQFADEINAGNQHSGHCFLLTADIIAPADTITFMVGSLSKIFKGIFDGGNHTIAVNITGSALFYFCQDAEIRNLNVTGRVRVTTTDSQGAGICGMAYSCGIYNCSNAAYIYSEGNYAGGICGVSTGTVANCYNTGTVYSPAGSGGIGGLDGNGGNGGICGYASGAVANCYNAGTVVSKYDAGGICGTGPSTVECCYNTGNVSTTGNCFAGGICGKPIAGTTVKHCFTASCQISNLDSEPSDKKGRICNGATILNCYASPNVTLNGTTVESSSTLSIHGKDTPLSDLQSQLWLAGNMFWNFSSAWCMIAVDQFPHLIWQYAGYQPVEITWSLPATMVYGETVSLSASSNNPTSAVQFVSSDPSIAQIEGNSLVARKVGNATVTAWQPAGSGYFMGASAKTLATLKLEINITANSAEMSYGDMPPVYTFTCNGFINGDSEAVLTRQPFIDCEADEQSPVGSYPIRISNAEADNYDFNYTFGTLTVNGSILLVRAKDLQRLYGEPNPTLEIEYSGFKNGETADILIQQPQVSCQADENSQPGNYPIVVSGGEALNYTLELQNGTLTVLPKEAIEATKVKTAILVSNSELLIAGKAIEVQIFDTRGCISYKNSCPDVRNGYTVLDISSIPCGVYAVSARVDGVQVIGKIVKH